MDLFNIAAYILIVGFLVWNAARLQAMPTYFQDHRIHLRKIELMVEGIQMQANTTNERLRAIEEWRFAFAKANNDMNSVLLAGQGALRDDLRVTREALHEVRNQLTNVMLKFTLLKGETGERGEKGDKGERGDRGVKGETG